MIRHVRTLGAAVFGAAVAAAILLLPVRRLGREPHLAEPGHLSPIVRGLLAHHMARHASDMAELEEAVVLLDFAKAAQLADRIAGEPPFARPIGDDATQINAQLPELFFVLQDELKADATRIGAAARSANIETLASAHASLARTCVACHGAYLREPTAATPRAP